MAPHIKDYKALSIFEPSWFSMRDKEYEWQPLCIGTGNTGINIKNLLLTEGEKYFFPVGKPSSVFQENLDSNVIHDLISNKAFAFLIGSIKDEEFWRTRDLILSHNIPLLFTIISSEDWKTIESNTLINDAETWLCIAEDVFTLSAVKSIRDICSMVLGQTLVGIDFADIRSTLRGNIFRVIRVESSLKDSHSVFKKMLLDIGPAGLNAPGLLLNILYDKNKSGTLDDITKMSDDLISHFVCDEIIWTCTCPLHLNNDFEATLIVPNEL